LILFKTSKSNELIDFQKYFENMKTEQKAIYYLISKKEIVDSPLLERFKKEDMEVILFDDEVDFFVIPSIEEYKEKRLKSISSTEVEEDFKKIDMDDSKYERLLNSIRETLKEKVKDVKITTRLEKYPACLIFDKDDAEYQSYLILKRMGNLEAKEPKPILEINPKHKIFTKLILSNEYSLLPQIALVLYNEARLLEGMEIEDVQKFSEAVNKILEGR